MSIPIERQVILVGNCSFLNGLDPVVLRNATTIRFSKGPQQRHYNNLEGPTKQKKPS